MIEYGTPPGAIVTLKEHPCGYTSREYNLTAGAQYKFKGFNGSCIVIATNEPGIDAHIHRGRAEIFISPAPAR